MSYSSPCIPPNNQTNDYTTTMLDCCRIVRMNKASAVSITIPPN